MPLMMLFGEWLLLDAKPKVSYNFHSEKRISTNVKLSDRAQLKYDNWASEESHAFFKFMTLQNS